MENFDLLESLQELVHCTYISDLRFAPYQDQAKRELLKMDISHYPLPVLEEGIEYLFGVKLHFFSMDEAVRFLKSNREIYETEGV